MSQKQQPAWLQRDNFPLSSSPDMVARTAGLARSCEGTLKEGTLKIVWTAAIVTPLNQGIVFVTDRLHACLASTILSRNAKMD